MDDGRTEPELRTACPEELKWDNGSHTERNQKSQPQEIPLPSEIADVMRDIHGRRVSGAMAAKAARGIMPGCAPLGYKNAWVKGEKAIVIDEGIAPLVREAFELAAAGMPLRKVLDVITVKGLRSRNGRPMGVSGLWNVLTNPFYTGRMRYGGQLVEGTHPAIVSEELFKRANNQ